MKKIAVIGAGIGGLTAGNLLARKGHKVTLFEAHTSPGGYTAGFWRQGFYFESGTLSFESSGVMFKTLEDLGLTDRVHFVKKKDRWISPYFDFYFDSYANFKDAVFRAFPSDRAGLDGYFAALDPIFRAMKPFIDKPFPMQFSGLKFMRAMLPYLILGPKYYRIVKKYKDQTVEDVADKYFTRGTPVHRFFSSLGYPKMGIYGLGGFFVTMSEDYWHCSDGMQRLADVLAESFKNAGGDLRLTPPSRRSSPAGEPPSASSLAAGPSKRIWSSARATTKRRF